MSAILVTGGSGFIGSNLMALLCMRHADIKIINADAGTYAARPPLWKDPPPNHMNIRVDIRDQAAVRSLFEEFQPQAVFHLAAESHVCRSISGPRDFATTNMMGTFNVLEEARRFTTEARGLSFVHVSTDEVFGEALGVDSFNEESQYRPRSPYAATKAASDMLVRAWRETYGLRATVVNMCNVFGPNQHPEKLIPMAITKILKGEEVTIHGTGENRREWLYVSRAVEAIHRAVHHPGEHFCLGGGVELTNLGMVRLVHDTIRQVLPDMKVELKLRHTNDRPTDDRRYAIDCSKARNVLRWDNGKDMFMENMKRTVTWYAYDILEGGGQTSHGWGG